MPIMDKIVGGLHLHFEPEEQEAASIIGTASVHSTQLMQQRWGLIPPEDCHVYVMTSWAQFLLQSAHGFWRVYIILTFPLLALRATTIWPFSGGWSFSYGRRQIVEVKPARLIQAGDRSIGGQFFTQDRDLNETVQTITCHELVHAFTSHLKLPAWLNEGLATLAMEYYLGGRLVRKETIDHLTSFPSKEIGRRRGRVQTKDREALLYMYARGYWLARYIDETRPELMKSLLAKRLKPDELEEKLASEYEKKRDSFWMEIDGELISYFNDMYTTNHI